MSRRAVLIVTVLAMVISLLALPTAALAHEERDADNCWDNQVPEAQYFSAESGQIGVPGGSGFGIQFGTDHPDRGGSAWADFCLLVVTPAACLLGFCGQTVIADAFLSHRTYVNGYGCDPYGIHDYGAVHSDILPDQHVDWPCDYD